LAVSWRDAPEVEEMAGPIIAHHHPEIAGYPIRFVFRSPARKRHNRTVLGTAEIVRGRFAWFVMTDDESRKDGQEQGPAMFWVEIASDEWETLNERQRRALVDHELCHCTEEENEDGEMVMAMRAHDVEEFNAIVKRYGLWKEDLWEFGLTVAEVGMEVPNP
jgi:hypothetical protein